MLQLALLVEADMSLGVQVNKLPISCHQQALGPLVPSLLNAFPFFNMLENNPGYTILYAFYQSYTPFVDFPVISEWFPGVQVRGTGAIQTGCRGPLGWRTYLRAWKRA